MVRVIIITRIDSNQISAENDGYKPYSASNS